MKDKAERMWCSRVVGRSIFCGVVHDGHDKFQGIAGGNDYRQSACDDHEKPSQQVKLT